jgi:hypothetical protein
LFFFLGSASRGCAFLLFGWQDQLPWCDSRHQLPERLTPFWV